MPPTHANMVRGANPASDDCSRIIKRLGWCHVTLIVYSSRVKQQKLLEYFVFPIHVRYMT